MTAGSGFDRPSFYCAAGNSPTSMPVRFTVRKVDLRTMGNLVRILVQNPGIGYAELFVQSRPLGFKTQSRLFHYLSTGRCMQLMFASRGHYAASALGRDLLSKLDASAEPLELARTIEKGLEKCPPLSKVLKAVTPSGIEPGLKAAMEKGEVVRVESSGRESFTLLDLSGQPRLVANTMTEVNEVRWGSIPILVQLGVLCWLYLGTDTEISGRYLFPVPLGKDSRAWEELVKDELHSLGAEKRWVPVGRLLYAMALRYRCEPKRVKAVIAGLAEQEPAEFQLSEATRELVTDDGFVDFRGSPRSHIRLGEVENA